MSLSISFKKIVKSLEKRLIDHRRAAMINLDVDVVHEVEVSSRYLGVSSLLHQLVN